MFIELLEFESKDLFININNIVSVARDNDITRVYTALDEWHIVKESYDQVKELIKREVAAEGGDEKGDIKMNLNTLFKRQQHLDEHMVKEKDLHGQDILNYKLTAIAVELEECLNEFTKIFKFWANKDNNRENGIEEFVDCVHFAISIANDLGYTSHEYIKTSPKDLNKLYIGLQNVLATLSVSRKERHVQSLL